MLINLCHACRRVNAADAKHCDACGVLLEGAATRPRPLRGSRRQAATALPEPAPSPELAITLREVGAAPAGSAAWPAAARRVTSEEVLISDHEMRPHLVRPMAATPDAAAPALPGAARSNDKAERRAAVRRSRKRVTPAVDDPPVVPEVLVFDAHDGDRDRLCNLLRGFGFGVHAVDRADKAAVLAVSRDFVAAFVDIALDAGDGGAGIDLCKRVRAVGPRPDGSQTLLVLVKAKLKPMDRVRAELVGCDETVAKPVTRGSVAGLLDARGIALPTDPRQG